MKQNPILETEGGRLAVLHQLQLSAPSSSEQLNDTVALASQICDAPMAALAFTDGKRWLLYAKAGILFSELDFSLSAMESSDDFVLVENTLLHNELAESSLVSGEPFIRFFAAMPLKNEAGVILAFLCLMDKAPRTLSPLQISGLRRLARQSVAMIEMQAKLFDYKVKQEQESTSFSEEKNPIFYNAPDAVIIINSKGTIVQWNLKAEKIFGWNKEEIVGRTFHETIIPSRHRGIYVEKLQGYKKNGEESLLIKPTELTAIRKDNTRFDIALSISPTTVKDQQYFICFVSDITDRKLITSRLDQQKEFYENILNSIPTDIAVFSPEHKYLYVNPGAIGNAELRKYIIGKDDFEYAKHRNRSNEIPEKRRKMFLEIKESKKEIRWEDTLPDPNGNEITHLRRLFPVHDSKGELTMVIGFGIDITERKTLEHEQEVLVKKQTLLVDQLSAQNTQLIDFCNIVSHNLRAPLVNMSMLVKFIEDSHDEAEQRTMITMLNPVIENLHATFSELVESIQIKQDLEIKSEKINLEDCVERTLSLLDAEIKKSQAEIIADFSEASTVFYPPKYIYSIFHNLLSNAMKYQSPDRKPVIQLKTKRVNNNIIFSVTDNGLGINLEKHKDTVFKIGKVFHRHPDAKGFGLFMTKTQVEAMGGRIWVESECGECSTFFIEFKNQHL